MFARGLEVLEGELALYCSFVGRNVPASGSLTVGLGTMLAGLLFLERLITCDLSKRSGTLPCPTGVVNGDLCVD